MLKFNKNKKTEDVNVDDEITKQIEQLEAEEIGIEEEIEDIKEVEEPVVKPKETDEDDDFEDEYEDDDDTPVEYKRAKPEKKSSKTKTEEEVSEQPQQLNIILTELDTRISKIESILFRLLQNGKQ